MQNGRPLLCSNLVSFDYDSNVHIRTPYTYKVSAKRIPQTVKNISQNFYLQLIARYVPPWKTQYYCAVFDFVCESG